MSPHKLLVLGMAGSAREHLTMTAVTRVLEAELLVGGDRQLAVFPDAPGEQVSLHQGIMMVAERLRQALDAGQRIVVLASGDPLCYGIGSTLRRWFAAEELEIIPAPSSYQLAFAALGEPWHDAALLSAHARPLAEVVRGVYQASKAAILTDTQQTPAVIAAALLGAGLPADSPCAICEHLAEAQQRIVRTTLGAAANQSFASLNVFVVWNEREALKQQRDRTIKRQSDKTHKRIGKRRRLLVIGRPLSVVRHPSLLTHIHISHRAPARMLASSPPRMLATAQPPGLPDAAFSTTGGLLTKREVRLLSLAELALSPHEVMWDVGAGSGAVGIEAARWQPKAHVYAIERRAELCNHIRINIGRFTVQNISLIEGSAPQACADLPAPHAIFIGGSGGQIEPIIGLARQRLQPNGRLVIALVSLEHLQIARTLMPSARIVQVQVNLGVPIVGMLRLEAQNPIFLLTWRNS